MTTSAPNPPVGPGSNQRTPDLGAVIQEVIDGPGWVAGNAVAAIITGTGQRTAESYNGSQGATPLLHIEHSPVNP